MELWPVQTKFVSLTLDAVQRGVRRYLITSPTGSGKSFAVARTIIELAELDYWAILFTNRRWLIDQLRGTLDKAGIDYGVRAAGYESDDDRTWPVQISSIPTERQRVVKRKTWRLFGKGRKKVVCFIDEAHLQAGAKDLELYKLHTDEGHQLVGITATPIGLGEAYDELGVAGTVSDCIACDALVPALHYGPDEPDFRALKSKPQEGQDFTAGQLKMLLNRPGLYGRVWENFNATNPNRRPTLLFADSVESSLWFAEQFTAAGVPAAHIDGEDIWIGGEVEKSETDSRQRLLAASRSGDIKVICNRYVAREGVDIPWIRHVIAATVFGSVGTYLQSLGRGLRADSYADTIERFGPKEHVTIQDHGGNWWRHGSVMMDRDWNLDDTSERIAGLRSNRMRSNPNDQPFTCPSCRRVWPGKGRKCSVAHGGCGFELPPREKRSRPVLTAKGQLKLYQGDIYKQRRLCTRPDGPKKWEKMYWRARSAKTVRKLVDGEWQDVTVGWDATFKQAFAMFAQENFWAWPDPSWPLMPIDPYDEFRLVKTIPMSRLRQAESVYGSSTLFGGTP